MIFKLRNIQNWGERNVINLVIILQLQLMNELRVQHHNYNIDIMMQKYRSKYHVQKVQPVKSRAKKIINNPIVTIKNQKASVITKKVSNHRSKQFDDQVINQQHESQNISKATNQPKIHRENPRPNIFRRPSSDLKGKKLQVAQRGKSLKYWKAESIQPKFIKTLKGFFNNMLANSDGCSCGGICEYAERWMEWIDIPQAIIRKHYNIMCHRIDPVQYNKKYLETDMSLESEEESESIRKQRQKLHNQIKKDMKRTQASYPAFQNEVVLGRGERILMCYAIEDPQVGYIQGMNMILSGFLYHIRDQAKTYAVVRKVFHSLRNNYLNNFKQCYEHVDQLIDLIQLNILDLYEHLTELGVDLKVICFPWMLSLMTVVVPLDSLHLVYEGFIKDGWNFIYRLGLAIFLYHKETLKEMDEGGDILVFLSATNEKKEDKNWEDIVEYAQELKKLI